MLRASSYKIKMEVPHSDIMSNFAWNWFHAGHCGTPFLRSLWSIAWWMNLAQYCTLKHWMISWLLGWICAVKFGLKPLTWILVRVSSTTCPERLSWNRRIFGPSLQSSASQFCNHRLQLSSMPLCCEYGRTLDYLSSLTMSWPCLTLTPVPSPPLVLLKTSA